MSITFRCPSCKQTYTAPDKMAGTTTPCKKCGAAIIVPSPAAAPRPAAAPSPAAAAPRPLPAGQVDLSDLLDDVAGPAAQMPLAPAPMVPFGSVAKKKGRGARSGFQWGRFFEGLVSSPVGIALVAALAGLVIFGVLLIAPKAAVSWAILCAIVGAAMVLTGAIWHLVVFFKHANQRDIGVLIVGPVLAGMSIGLLGVIAPVVAGLVVHVVMLGLLVVCLAFYVAATVYGLWWLIANWRWTRTSFSIYLIGVAMFFGAGFCGAWLRDKAGLRDRVAATPDRNGDDEQRLWPDAQRQDPPQSPTNNPPPPTTSPVGDPSPPGDRPGRTVGPTRGRAPATRSGAGIGPRAGQPTPTPTPRGAPAASAGRRTELLGGSGGGPFESARAGAPVLGFDYRLGSWAGQQAVGSLRPVFAQQGLAASRVMAKDGYAVGALEVDSAEFVNAVRVVFMRIDAQGRPDPKDSYQSPWIGTPTGRPTKTLGGDGSRVIGIHGRGTAVLDAIGLVLE